MDPRWRMRAACVFCCRTFAACDIPDPLLARAFAPPNNYPTAVGGQFPLVIPPTGAVDTDRALPLESLELSNGFFMGRIFVTGGIVKCQNAAKTAPAAAASFPLGLAGGSARKDTADDG